MEKGQTLVTAIIPSYNRRALTERAVRSVLAQTHTNIEVVVVDDCSREEEVFVLTPEFSADPRVRLVRHEVNLGLAAARNTGVQAARGEVIAGLDCDDIWFPDKVEKQLAFYDAQADPKNTLVYSTYYWEQDGKWLPFPRNGIRAGEALSEYLFVRQGDIQGSYWMGSRSLFERFPRWNGHEAARGL